MIDKTIPLDHLPAGCAACVRRVVGKPCRAQRLREIGLCDGARVRMFRPGNPCIVRVAGNKICFRPNASVRVFVEPLATVD